MTTGAGPATIHRTLDSPHHARSAVTAGNPRIAANCKNALDWRGPAELRLHNPASHQHVSHVLVADPQESRNLRSAVPRGEQPANLVGLARQPLRHLALQPMLPTTDTRLSITAAVNVVISAAVAFRILAAFRVLVAAAVTVFSRAAFTSRHSQTP